MGTLLLASLNARVISAVTEDLLLVLAELQEASRCWPGDSPPSLVSD